MNPMANLAAANPLDALRPLHAPPPVPWWPPAPGWWLLALLAVTAAVLLWRWWRRGALLRTALRELKKLAILGDQPQRQAADLNLLLKRYVRASRPDLDAPALTGESWLAFLDEHGGKGEFVQGPGRKLLTLPYSQSGSGDEQLIALVRRWLKANRTLHNQG